MLELDELSKSRQKIRRRSTSLLHVQIPQLHSQILEIQIKAKEMAKSHPDIIIQQSQLPGCYIFNAHHFQALEGDNSPVEIETRREHIAKLHEHNSSIHNLHNYSLQLSQRLHWLNTTRKSFLGPIEEAGSSLRAQQFDIERCLFNWSLSLKKSRKLIVESQSLDNLHSNKNLQCKLSKIQKKQLSVSSERLPM